GVAGNVAILALYAVTRTLGIPFFGPDAGSIEHIGTLDLISAAAELALVVALVALLRGRTLVGQADAPTSGAPSHLGESIIFGRPLSDYSRRMRRLVMLTGKRLLAWRS